MNGMSIEVGKQRGLTHYTRAPDRDWCTLCLFLCILLFVSHLILYSGGTFMQYAFLAVPSLSLINECGLFLIELTC